jgi:hypothetical protein
VYELYDLLIGSQALEHVFADSALGHSSAELFGDFEVHITLKEGCPNLFHRRLNVSRCEPSSSSNFFECAF